MGSRGWKERVVGDGIREQVRRRYAEVARSVGEGPGCCGDGCACGGAEALEVAARKGLYRAQQELKSGRLAVLKEDYDKAMPEIEVAPPEPSPDPAGAAP